MRAELAERTRRTWMADCTAQSLDWRRKFSFERRNERNRGGGDIRATQERLRQFSRGLAVLSVVRFDTVLIPYAVGHGHHFVNVVPSQMARDQQLQRLGPRSLNSRPLRH